MKASILIGVLVMSAFLEHAAVAQSNEVTGSEHRHNPVVYSPNKADPFDQYPKEIIRNVIRQDRSIYTLCNNTSCTLIRNFGHDSTIQREYIEHLIDQRRAAQ